MFQPRKLTAAFLAASLLICGLTSTSNAGLFNHCNKCCEPVCCCEAAPTCCPAPEPTCCAPKPTCCKPAPPPKVSTTLCLKDPCSCCTKSVTVCIPACCANEAPCITCRKGMFGRKIYTATWKCCGHSAKIVWTKHGDVRVR